MTSVSGVKYTSIIKAPPWLWSSLNPGSLKLLKGLPPGRKRAYRSLFSIQLHANASHGIIVRYCDLTGSGLAREQSCNFAALNFSFLWFFSLFTELFLNSTFSLSPTHSSLFSPLCQAIPLHSLTDYKQRTYHQV